MDLDPLIEAYVDEQGRLVFPPEVAASYGLLPGANVTIRRASNHLQLDRPATHLAKVYIEPTNRCNLTCRTCIRNSWQESLGRMSKKTFSSIVHGLKAFNPPPAVFFGGYGEPLFHPNILEMIRQVKEFGCRVELITNGILLTKKKAQALVEIGVDTLWVSVDGSSAEHFSDIRPGAVLPDVLSHIDHFRLASENAKPQPEIGIAFVAMQRNIRDLSSLVRMGIELGASRFIVTNLLPHTANMCKDILYPYSISRLNWRPSHWAPELNLPRMDLSFTSTQILVDLFREGTRFQLNGDSLEIEKGRCPFISRGSTSIAWDGSLSPCLPLVHNHISYLDWQQRSLHRWVVGNVNERDLSSLWNDEKYLEFRQKVKRFPFSPCIVCSGCYLRESNEEDCIGNSHPTCGGCLWAQGIIQCP